MRNRWFHTPVLHSPAPGVEKKPGWLELFYDLVFVAAFIQLGNGLSDNVSPAGFVGFVALFIPMWVVWTGFAFYMNRLNVDDFLHRILVFAQMFAVGAMAVNAAPAINQGELLGFAVSYAVAQAIVSALWLRAWLQVPEARAYCRYWGVIFGIGAVIWLVAILLPLKPAIVLCALGVSAVLASPFSRQSRELSERYPTDMEHLTERYGLLTIIVLGESFVKVLSALISADTGGGTILQASLLLLLTCCIWWIYFDDVAGSELREGGFTPIIWLYAHIPLQAAVVAAGVAIKKVALLDMSLAATDTYRWLLSGTLALTCFSVALIDSVTERRQSELSDKPRVFVRLFSAFLILALAPASSNMSAGMYVLLVATVCVAQVVFDMMMAPFEAVHESDMRPLDADDSHLTIQARDAAKGAGATNVVRKGTPNELKRDIYFYFMEGGWFRFMGSLLFIYVISNVFFAALYMLRPDCIANARTGSFADAFFFSVQTMSTIGFGGLQPATNYGDVLVTVEAAFGLLGVALATGFMFAKVSRPNSKVLFSHPAVITGWHGKPTFMFRVGNARGNEIVDATIHCTCLRRDVSPEGDVMQRMYDMDLVRDRSPVFAMSWNVMHTVDESSPLFGIDWSEEGAITGIVVTLMGHDGTYAQTVYSRHVYGQDEIYPQHRFREFVSTLDDGRYVLDFDRFHDIEPE